MEKLTVFYDGKCHLCFREIQHYAKRDKDKNLNLVDITESTFDASAFGLSDAEVNLHMHVQNSEGETFKGVDAFIEIWKRIPPYQLLIPVFENRLLKPFWLKSYEVFAHHIRPKLPKRNCEDGACAVNHQGA